MITRELINQALTWPEYIALHEMQVETKQTSGPKQTEELINYTNLNWTRIQRILKTGKLHPEVSVKLENASKSYIFLVITETWCGDAAQTVPMIAKMIEGVSNIEMRLIFRDENPEVMDQYLTNGARSIPMVIILEKETLDEVAVWGPKPKEAMEILAEYKADPNMNSHDFHKKLHTWYAKNKSQDVQKEVLELIS